MKPPRPLNNPSRGWSVSHTTDEFCMPVSDGHCGGEGCGPVRVRRGRGRPRCGGRRGGNLGQRTRPCNRSRYGMNGTGKRLASRGGRQRDAESTVSGGQALAWTTGVHKASPPPHDAPAHWRRSGWRLCTGVQEIYRNTGDAGNHAWCLKRRRRWWRQRRIADWGRRGRHDNGCRRRWPHQHRDGGRVPAVGCGDRRYNGRTAADCQHTRGVEHHG